MFSAFPCWDFQFFLFRSIVLGASNTLPMFICATICEPVDDLLSFRHYRSLIPPLFLSSASAHLPA